MTWAASARMRPGVRSPNRQTFQADIARALGLCQSTVSIGLKGDPRVAAATRAAILKKAAELGYAPDPMLQALANYRRGSQRKPVAAALAWLTNYPTRTGWHGKTALAYRAGAQRRAEELGFGLDEFWLREPSVTPGRLRQILFTRGIRGLLLAPQERFGVALDFDFGGFAAVTYGYTLARPVFHLVSNHQHRSVACALRELAERGHRRVGIMLYEAVDARVDHNFLAGYFATVKTTPGLRALPPLVTTEFRAAAFARWFERARPEAILCNEGFEAPVRAWCAKRGLAIPRDLALAGLDRYADDPAPLAGIDQRSTAIGAAGVDLLAGMLARFEYGVPAVPLRVLIEGVWCEGASVAER